MSPLCCRASEIRTEKPRAAGVTYHNRILKVRVESEKVALKVVHDEIHVLLRHRRVDHQVRRRRGSRRVTSERGLKVGASVRVKREVSPDTVRVWIRPDYVFEPAGGDLIIVGGVTPTTDVGARIPKEFRVVDVMRV